MKAPRLLCAVLPAILAAFSPSACPQQGTTPDPAFKDQLERGQKALQDNKYKEALDAFKNANKIQHNACGQCYFLLAITYFRMHDLSHTMESCDKAIATAETDGVRALAHNLKGNLLLGSSRTDSKKLAQAESEFKAAVQLDPKSPMFHLNLAKALLRESKDEVAKRELQACLNCGPEEKLAREARQLIADPRRGREELAPDFELTTMQGQQLSLQQLAGRVVVMDFWATWCPPCRESVPELKALTRKYPTEKLVLISVSGDKDENAWRDFVAKKKMDWAQYRDSNHKILDAFGIQAFPTYLVIDGEGVIRERITGLNPQETVVYRLKATLGQMPQLEGEAGK
jgi:thioredoxin-like negative regulator of GroEL